MADRRLDNVVREVAVGGISRRAALKALVGLALALLAPTGPVIGQQAPRCKAADRRCVLDADCCSNRCRRGRCKGSGTCLANGDLLAGSTCEAGATCCSRTCQTTYVEDGCGMGERCCELANQPRESIRGRCTTNRDCCSCRCVDGRCRTNVG